MHGHHPKAPPPKPNNSIMDVQREAFKKLKETIEAAASDYYQATGLLVEHINMENKALHSFGGWNVIIQAAPETRYVPIFASAKVIP